MLLPLLAQIAIATYRHGADDADDEGSAAIGGVNAGELDSLRVAPGGPTDVQLDDIDTRSPIAGLYVRLERLLAKQVSERRSTCAMSCAYSCVMPHCMYGRHTSKSAKPRVGLAQLKRNE